MGYLMLFGGDMRIRAVCAHVPGIDTVVQIGHQLVGNALAAHGGEILKFVGDGVMAYFPAEDALFLPMVTAGALNAARQVIGDIEAANEARAAGGAEPVRFGIGLHVGTVTFGNVGTEDRLDFTVIGVPQVTSLLPASVLSGGRVTLAGSSLDLVSQVRVNARLMPLEAQLSRATEPATWSGTLVLGGPGLSGN
mgnify:CR=1 FL=1